MTNEPKVNWGSEMKNDPAFFLNKKNKDWEKENLTKCEQCNSTIPKEDLMLHKKIWCDKNYKQKIKSETLAKLDINNPDLSEQKAQVHLRVNSKVLESLQYLAWKKRNTINELINGVLIQYLDSERENLERGENV